MQQQIGDISPVLMNSLRSSLSSNNFQVHVKAIQDYNVLGPLSRGSGGFVFQIESRKQRKLSALKVIYKNTPKKDLQKKVKNEIAIHESLKSQHVIQLINKFEDKDNYYMVLQYCSEGDLEKYMKRHKVDKDLKDFALQIAKGINYLHDNDVTHRDLKPQNLLLTTEKKIKICDFGYSLKGVDKMRGIVGTLNYMAPEIMKMKTEYTNKVDVWAYGCIIYLMAVGHTPYQFASLKSMVSQEIREQDIEWPDSICEDLLDLLKNVLKIDPSQRYSIKDVLNHHYFTQPKKDSRMQLKDMLMKRIPSFKNMPTIETAPSCNLDERFKQKEDKENFNNANRTEENFRKPRKSESPRTSFEKMETRRGSHRTNIQTGELTKQMLQRELKEKIQTKPQRSFSPVSTFGLKPTKMQTAQGNIIINEHGFFNEVRDSQLVFSVSPRGHDITISRKGNSKNFTITSLPIKYHSLYKYCKDVIKIIKNNSARIKIEDQRGRFSLMWTGRFLAQFPQRKVELSQWSPARDNEPKERSLAKRYLRAMNQLIKD